MTVWEYMVLEMAEPVDGPTLKMLDHYGAMGWEAYAVTRQEDSSVDPMRAWSAFHMKRPRPSQVRSVNDPNRR